MVSLLLIERVLEELRNLSQIRINKGSTLEKKTSLKVHKSGQALLVHSKVLRDLGAGQIDLARIKNGVIEVFEVKSFAFISRIQKRRLLRSAEYLSSTFDMSCRISVIFQDF